MLFGWVFRVRAVGLACLRCFALGFGFVVWCAEPLQVAECVVIAEDDVVAVGAWVLAA